MYDDTIIAGGTLLPGFLPVIHRDLQNRHTPYGQLSYSVCRGDTTDLLSAVWWEGTSQDGYPLQGTWRTWRGIVVDGQLPVHRMRDLPSWLCVKIYAFVKEVQAASLRGVLYGE